jgi:hypothetical protein
LTRARALVLSEPEHRLAALLIGRWRDCLYAPGPGVQSPLEPGVYASSFIVLPEDGPALRVSSLVVPAFGGDLCRIRLEPLLDYRLQRFGSLFEPSRRGTIYAMAADRRGGGARSPDQPGWSAEDPSLVERLSAVTRVRVLRERIDGGRGDGAFSWVADRGLALTGPGGEESLFLARPDEDERAVLASPLGLYRALLDPAITPVPGASHAELLGYGDWAQPFTVSIEALPLSDPAS